MKISHILIALMAAMSAPVYAANSINLGGYSVAGTYALDIFNGTSGGLSGLEGSAITYARDRGTLFFVGDEGTGVVEISTTGQTIGNMTFDWTGTGSTKHDAEGLTYMGNGALVVVEERLQDAYRFNYVANTSATLANNFVSISNATVGNSGMEGISYDPRNGSFVTIKQENPQNILAGNLTFSNATGGVSTMASLFDPTLMGLTTLSDVQTLSPIDALFGTAAADNLLVLSLGSRQLIEVNRNGQVKSSFDLTNILAHNGIEGVTVDEKGTIYLVAEQIQDGSNGLDLNPKSQLIVLSPVPEPETYGMMLMGLGLMGFVARRRKNNRA